MDDIRHSGLEIKVVDVMNNSNLWLTWTTSIYNLKVVDDTEDNGSWAKSSWYYE